MSRYRSSGSTSHKVIRLGGDFFRLSWVVDRYYTGSRLRHPTRYTRETDTVGMLKFCAKWDIETPDERDLRLFREKKA